MDQWDGNQSYYGSRLLIYINSSSALTFEQYGSTRPTASTSILDGNWHWFDAASSGSDCAFYLDGVYYPYTSGGGYYINVNGSLLYVNSVADNIGYYGDVAVFDETRVFSGTLSPSYILAKYNNQSSPPTFYSIGSETSYTPSVMFPVFKKLIP